MAARSALSNENRLIRFCSTEDELTSSSAAVSQYNSSSNASYDQHASELYEFGAQFVYNKCASDRDDAFYVHPKYNNIEEEVIKNALFSSPKHSTRLWQETLKTAQQLHQKMELYCKALQNEQMSCFDKFGIEFYSKNDDYWNCRFSIAPATPISIAHLCSVILFFKDTRLATTIRKTFRYWTSDETLHHIKYRHSHFAHTAKHIFEAIYLYGHPLKRDAIVYRGVTIQLFPYLDASFSGPLSTTEDYYVANAFSACGCVLTLKNSESGFDVMYIYGASGLSCYPAEKECLLFSPYLKIIDIHPQQFHGSQFNFKPYIYAMILFQKVVKGQLLSCKEKKELFHDNIITAYTQLIQLLQLKTASNHAINIGKEMIYVNELWNNVFGNLMTASFLWINDAIVSANKNISNSMNTLRSIQENKIWKFVKVFEWKITATELQAYIGEQRVDVENERKCNIVVDDKRYEIELYLVLKACNILNNKWYNAHVVLVGTEKLNTNLLYSCDIICDEMDICLHFPPREISKYPQRSHNHAFSTATAQSIVTQNIDSCWQVAFRFF